MDRFVKQASREANWVQAPGPSRQTPAKRQPGRPHESEEKKRLRREEKEAQKETLVEGTPTKRRNEKEEDLRTAISLLADELLKSDPEKAERAKQIHELLCKDAMKQAGDLKSAEGGKLQGPAGEKGSPSGKLGGANKVKFKEGEGNKGTSAKDKRASANLSYQGGWVRREAHKKIPQKYAFIQRIKAKKEAAGIGEAEDPSQEFWLEVMKEDYPWMKQVRPLKRLWDQRKKLRRNLRSSAKPQESM